MTKNNIDLLGIDNDAYYFLNPIFVKIQSSTKFITKATLKLTNNTAMGSDGNSLSTAELKLQSNPEGIIYVDISDYINSIAVYPNGYRAKSVNNSIPNSLNDINIVIKVSTKEDATETIFSLDKLFIRGYIFSQYTNIEVLDINLIRDNNSTEIINVPYYKYPMGVYNNLSLMRFKIVDRKINYTKITEQETNILNHNIFTGCEPLMIRFLNSAGSYSHVVFNSYTYSSKSSPDDTKIKVNRFKSDYVSFINQKVSHEKEYTAIQEFDERFKSFVDELVRSQYVQVMFGVSDDWIEVDIQQNTMPAVENDSFELSYRFKLQTSINL